MNIKVWKDDEIVKENEAVGISHFHVKRDYLVELDSGEFLELSYDLVKQIVEHELEEMRLHYDCSSHPNCYGCVRE